MQDTRSPQAALEDALKAAETALQAALAAMIRDPALVSLLASRLLRATTMVHRAQQKLSSD